MAAAAAAAAPTPTSATPTAATPTPTDNFCNEIKKKISDLITNLGSNPHNKNMNISMALINELITKGGPGVFGDGKYISELRNIDDQIFKYFGEEEYKSFIDEDKKKIDEVAIELMLQQILMLATIICKPKVPFIPDFMNLTLKKLKAMNSIKNDHVEKLKNPTPYKMSGGSKKMKKIEYKCYKNLYLLSKI
jgi:hypothetical protein